MGADVVDDAIAEMLASAPDDPIEQRGRLYDLGLAWVHHARGRGGLGAAPGRQLDVVRQVQDRGIAVGTHAAGGGVALAGPTLAVHASDEPVRAPAAPLVHRRGLVVPAVQRAGCGVGHGRARVPRHA